MRTRLAVVAFLLVALVTIVATTVLIARRSAAPGHRDSHDATTRSVETSRPTLPDDLDHVDPRVAALLRRTHAAVATTPTDAAAWHQYAKALHANEYYARAAVGYRAALDRDRTRARAWHLLGLVETRLGHPEAALAAFDAAASRDDRFAPARWRRGLVLLEQGDASAAATAFREALRLDPADASAHLGLARAELALGRPAEVVGLLENHARGGYASHLLAVAWRRLGEPDRAAAEAERAGDARPAWTDPWEQSLAALRPGYGARIAEARGLIAARRIREAIALLETLRREQPGNVTVLANLGLAYRLAGRLAESVAVLRHAVALNAAHSQAHFHLAVTYCQLARTAPPGSGPASGDVSADPVTLRAAATRHVDRALALNPSYAAAHSLRGDLAQMEARPRQAVASYVEAARCDPDDARWPFRVGVCLMAVGAWPDALVAFERSAALDPTDAETHRAVALAAMKTSHYERAARALAVARDLAPGDPRLPGTAARLEALRAGAPSDGGGRP